MGLFPVPCELTKFKDLCFPWVKLKFRTFWRRFNEYWDQIFNGWVHSQILKFYRTQVTSSKFPFSSFQPPEICSKPFPMLLFFFFFFFWFSSSFSATCHKVSLRGWPHGLSWSICGSAIEFSLRLPCWDYSVQKNVHANISQGFISNPFFKL